VNANIPFRRVTVRRAEDPGTQHFDFGTGCAYFESKFDICLFVAAGMERTSRSSGPAAIQCRPRFDLVQLALLPLGVINVNIHRLLFLYRFPLSGGRSGGG
jgi:hypothetical protein